MDSDSGVVFGSISDLAAEEYIAGGGEAGRERFLQLFPEVKK
jgi:hypothetical protein